MFHFSIEVKQAAWMSNPADRWNAGLERAGLEFRQGVQISQYPPIPPDSTYIRTGTLAHKAGFSITRFGAEMQFGSTSYLPYLLRPAKSVQHWAGKREELVKAMQEGFAQGVKEYRSE